MKRSDRLATLLSAVLLATGCDAPASFSLDEDAAESRQGSTPEPKVAAIQVEPSEPAAPPSEPESPPSEPEPPRSADATEAGSGPTMAFATPAVIERSKEIAAAARTDWIPNEALKGANSALAVLHLAQTASDPKLAGAALKALPGLYWARDHETRRTVDDDYVAVVVRRLSSDDPYILEGAFAAAETAARVEPPDPTIIDALVLRTDKAQKPEARILAMRCLAGVKPLTTELQQVFLDGLGDDDASVVALTLSAMTMYGNRFTQREPLIETLRALATSDHAAVRGKALGVLTNVDRGAAHRDATTELALEMLKDEHPLVRGEAVYALGAMRQVQHADKVVAMMDDAARVRMRLDGWSNLDGSSANKRVLAPGGETVTATALLSLAIMSTATDTKFEYVKLVDRKKIGHPDHTKAVEAAKAWLAKHNDET